MLFISHFMFPAERFNLMFFLLGLCQWLQLQQYYSCSLTEYVVSNWLTVPYEHKFNGVISLNIEHGKKPCSLSFSLIWKPFCHTVIACLPAKVTDSSTARQQHTHFLPTSTCCTCIRQENIRIKALMYYYPMSVLWVMWSTNIPLPSYLLFMKILVIQFILRREDWSNLQKKKT